MLKVTIIDGYIDEPTCLGVPPYISPYPRYIAGAILCFDKSAHISYLTIDQIRNDNNLLHNLSNSDLIVVIAGMSVPGRYLSGFPASPKELVFYMNKFARPIKILTGPAARYGFGISGGKKTKDISFVKDAFDLIIKGDGEIVISDLLKNKFKFENIDLSKSRKNASFIRNYAILGSRIVKLHPNFPDYLIAEIETYRGCPRSIIGGCSFCSEPSKGSPDFRSIKDIIDEIKELYDNGLRHFRLGSQPCIFSYMAKNAEKKEHPRPNPDALEKLFKGIRNIAPNLKTLHIDNANPGVIARFPYECKQICKTIIKYHTPGDVAAFGVESVDPIVVSKNNLKANSDEIIRAIKLFNRIGSKKGKNGMPELLPGLNFVFGLIGETKKTYNLNYDFLKEIYDKNLLVRRINLRQVIPIPGTKMGEVGNKIISKNKQHFLRFKKKVKTNIERPMLEKMLPFGSILRDIYTEKHDGKLTFGRQVGSYPLLIGIPGILQLNNFIDLKVVDYGFRSITAVPFPLNINKASRETIEALPGIGKKRAIRILSKRPFKDKNQLMDALDDQASVENILDYISID
jgi:radical SAM superfamily enzyme with C-terminal helix-hairpin-helix motif